jgi:hypothetical protein
MSTNNSHWHAQPRVHPSTRPNTHALMVFLPSVCFHKPTKGDCTILCFENVFGLVLKKTQKQGMSLTVSVAFVIS